MEGVFVIHDPVLPDPALQWMEIRGRLLKSFSVIFMWLLNDMNHRGLMEEAEIAGKQKWQVKVKKCTQRCNIWWPANTLVSFFSCICYLKLSVKSFWHVSKSCWKSKQSLSTTQATLSSLLPSMRPSVDDVTLMYFTSTFKNILFCHFM